MKMHRWAMPLVAAATFAAFTAFSASGAFAQDAAASSNAEEARMTIGKFLDYGGWVGWLIILCSVVMVALVIEHSVSIKREKLVPPEVVDELEALLQEQEYQEALNLCQSEPNFVTNMVGASLGKMAHGFEEMRGAALDAAAAEFGKLKQKISYLSLLANIGPMLGLFGTVYGMVAAFGEIVALGASVTPKDLAQGVQSALITTVLGLLVAMPCIVASFIFSNKIITVAAELQSIGEDMIERFRTQGQTA